MLVASTVAETKIRHHRCLGTLFNVRLLFNRALVFDALILTITFSTVAVSIARAIAIVTGGISLGGKSHLPRPRKKLNLDCLR